VRLQEAFDDGTVVGELRLGQLRAERLQHLCNVLHRHCKAFYRLRGQQRARLINKHGDDDSVAMATETGGM